MGSSHPRVLTCIQVLFFCALAALLCGFGAPGRYALSACLPLTLTPLPSVEPAPASPPAKAILPRAAPADFAAQVVVLVNRERVAQGLVPLEVHSSLANAALVHSADMAVHDFFGHIGSDGSTPSQRAIRAGYGSGYVGENIAGGFSSPGDVVAAWMSSPGHRANILNEWFLHIGCGYFYLAGTTYGHYWTLDLGRSTGGDGSPTPMPTPTGYWTPTATAVPHTPTPTLTRRPTKASTATPTSTPAWNAYRFEGLVLREGTGAGLAGVQVSLYRWQEGMWVLVKAHRTDSSGAYAFHYAGPDERFALVAQNLEGYVSVAATASTYGTVVDADRVVFDLPNGRVVVSAEFYDRALDWAPSPTPSPSLTPLPSPTTTAIPTMLRLRQGLDGYTGVCDTHIDARSPDANYAARRTFDVRSGNLRSALLRFDLGEIPPGAWVQSATLRLHVTASSNPHPLPLELYGLRREWECNTVNWVQPWSERGAGDTVADRDPSPASYATLTEVDVWASLDITELAHRWVRDPTENHGLILIGAGDVSVQYHLTSSDYENPNLRPELVVEYFVP